MVVGIDAKFANLDMWQFIMPKLGNFKQIYAMLRVEPQPDYVKFGWIDERLSHNEEMQSRKLMHESRKQFVLRVVILLVGTLL